MDELQDRRRSRVAARELRVVVPEKPRRMPRTPSDLAGAGRLMWYAYWHDEVSLAATAVDTFDIHRYCRLIQKREELEAEIWVEPVVENESGQQPNARFKIVRELSREIEAVREELGILPMSRKRLSLKAVQAEVKRREMVAQPERPRSREVIDLDALG